VTGHCKPLGAHMLPQERLNLGVPCSTRLLSGPRRSHVARGETYTITHGLTDPKKVYVLRWIAGRHAGVPEFAPPYTIAV
jgi:hypothetical protein